MAREREREVGVEAAGCGGVQLGEGNYKIALPNFEKKIRFFSGDKIFFQIKNVVGNIYPKFKIFQN